MIAQTAKKVFWRLAENSLSDSTFLKLKYWRITGEKLNLKAPQKFNEKLQWLKLFDHRLEYSIFVDKYAVKDYVSTKIGGEYVIPTLKYWDSANDIDLTGLPDNIVLKCSHNSGGVVLLHKKSELTDTIVHRLEDELHRNYYSIGKEWPYKNVHPRIIAEPLLGAGSLSEINDYKFFCFNGVPKIFKVDFNRFTDHHANYYDIRGNLIPFGEISCPPDLNAKLCIPDNLNEMLGIAQKLSKGYPFIRVDLYNVNGKIYFGELTLYPASGFGLFTDDYWNTKMGEWIDLKIC